jgi:hypothetical protein
VKVRLVHVLALPIISSPVGIGVTLETEPLRGGRTSGGRIVAGGNQGGARRTGRCRVETGRAGDTEKGLGESAIS